jgi:hypothetical protein
MFHLNNGITHILFGMWCPISNYGCAIVIGYLITFTGCVLYIRASFSDWVLSTRSMCAKRNSLYPERAASFGWITLQF